MLTKSAKDGLVGEEFCEISCLLSNLAHIRSVYFHIIHFVVLRIVSLLYFVLLSCVLFFTFF